MPVFSYKLSWNVSDRMIRFFLFLFLAFFVSCKKDNSNESGSGNTVKGGKVIITAQVKHHSFSVAGCEVYLKYNSPEFPGKDITAYNVHKTADPNGFVQFEALPNGEHFLYALGWDLSVSDSVSGYIPISVSAKPGEEKEYDFQIPVSE